MFTFNFSCFSVSSSLGITVSEQWGVWHLLTDTWKFQLTSADFRLHLLWEKESELVQRCLQWQANQLFSKHMLSANCLSKKWEVKTFWSFEIDTWETFSISGLYDKNLMAGSVWWGKNQPTATKRKNKTPNLTTTESFWVSSQVYCLLSHSKISQPLFLLKYSYSD